MVGLTKPRPTLLESMQAPALARSVEEFQSVAEAFTEHRDDAQGSLARADREGLDAIHVNRVGDIDVHGLRRPAAHREMAQPLEKWRADKRFHSRDTEQDAAEPQLFKLGQIVVSGERIEFAGLHFHVKTNLEGRYMLVPKIALPHVVQRAILIRGDQTDAASE